MAAKSNNTQLGRYSYGGGSVDLGDRLGWWERASIPSAPTDITITLTNKYVRRPDLLSYDVYGQSTLMWLVLQYNNIIDINTEFVEGSVITLPAKNRVFTEIMNKRQSPISKT